MKIIRSTTASAVVFVLLLTLVLCPGSARASGLLFQFDTPFPTDPDPAGPSPWIDAFFQDVSPGTVLLTITNVNLTAGEFVAGNGNGANGGLFFNLNPALNPAGLTFGFVSSSGNFTVPAQGSAVAPINTGTDSFKADGDGYYDIQIDFDTSSGDRFAGGDSVTYQITGIPGLIAADFGYMSQPSNGGSGPFYAAAHVQGLAGGASTWIEPSQMITISPVPEPSSLVALFIGFCAWGVVRNRKPTHALWFIKK